MTNFLKPLFCLLIVLLALTSCKKTPAEEPAPLTGSITGTFSPAFAAAEIRVFKNGGPDNWLVDSSYGTFRITDLEPGTYTIVYTAIPGYQHPQPVEVVVRAGEETNAGAVVFQVFVPGQTQGGITGTISPATAVSQVWASRKDGLGRYSVLPDANGKFTFQYLPAAEYSVSFIPSIIYSVPPAKSAVVAAGSIVDVGSVTLTLLSNERRPYDTIAGNVILNSSQLVNDFILRAANDSVIVVDGLFSVVNQFISPELAVALNKVMVVKQTFTLSGIQNISIAFNQLKETGGLQITNPAGLVSIDLHELRQILGPVTIRNTLALTSLNLASLLSVTGSLTLVNTGFQNMLFLNNATLKPVNLTIESNTKMSSLTGMNFIADSVSLLTIKGNTLLTAMDGMQQLRKVRNEAVISANSSLQTLAGMENFTRMRQLTLTDNPLLNSICPAKNLLNYLKDAPAYIVFGTNVFGELATITRQPLIASKNGSYLTKADLLAAVALCP